MSEGEGEINKVSGGETLNGSENSVLKGGDYAFFPRHNNSLHSLYEELRDSFWVPSEINFSPDRDDWERMANETDEATLRRNKGILKFIEHILAFFAQADGIVNENLLENFQRETGRIKEARDFYSMQVANETIHSETYSLSIETLIRNTEKKQRMFQATRNYPSVKCIAKWIEEYMNPATKSLLERVVGFCCVEGVLFTSAFCAIYWLKKYKIFRGLWKANEFIARDEGIHTRFGIALYTGYTTKGFVVFDGDEYTTLTSAKLSDETITQIISSAVDVASQFIRDALKVELVGLSSDDMIKYVQSTANTLAKDLGVASRIYDVENPFDWMAVISLPNKTNFFEDDVSEYAKVKYDPSEMVESLDF